MALKTILIKGPLTSAVITEKLVDTDLSAGKWIICMKQVLFDTFKEELPFVNISISTNLVSDFRDINNQREFFYPTLALFNIDDDKFSKSFDQIWFEINNPHKTIEIFFKSCFTETPLILQSNVAFQLLLRKVC